MLALLLLLSLSSERGLECWSSTSLFSLLPSTAASWKADSGGLGTPALQTQLAVLPFCLERTRSQSTVTASHSGPWNQAGQQCAEQTVGQTEFFNTSNLQYRSLTFGKSVYALQLDIAISSYLSNLHLLRGCGCAGPCTGGGALSFL